MKELRLAGISDMEAGNAYLHGFKDCYNAQFAKAPAKPDNLHRALNVEPDRLADVMCWRENRYVGKQLTFSYDRKRIMPAESDVTRGLVGKYVDTYPIDCAILLCLSGGWPASVPCARARVEFIRRITPWPVEPPLQIWRCPMGASYQSDRTDSGFETIYDARSEDQNFRQFQSLPLSGETDETNASKPLSAVLRRSGSFAVWSQNNLALRLVQDRADIDISGPEFNFVRSIRVFDVRYARQVPAGSEGDCERSASIFLGTYGTQGGFAWARASPTALPSAHVGPERWGLDCPSIYHRSVFVEWHDYVGNYGFGQVNYCPLRI